VTSKQKGLNPGGTGNAYKLSEVIGSNPGSAVFPEKLSGSVDMTQLDIQIAVACINN